MLFCPALHYLTLPYFTLPSPFLTLSHRTSPSFRRIIRPFTSPHLTLRLLLFTILPLPSPLLFTVLSCRWAPTNPSVKSQHRLRNIMKPSMLTYSFTRMVLRSGLSNFILSLFLFPSFALSFLLLIPSNSSQLRFLSPSVVILLNFSSPLFDFISAHFQ